MKNYFFVLSLFVTVVTLTLYGCSEDDMDPCENVVCGPGECDNGSCICPPNFTGSSCESCIEGMEGENCDIEIREKFLGNYKVVAGFCSGGLDGLDATDMILDSRNTGILDIQLTLTDGLDTVMMDGSVSNDTFRVEGFNVGDHYIEGVIQENGDIIGSYRFVWPAFDVDGTCDVDFIAQ